MRTAILQRIIDAHLHGDEAAFRKAALQLASEESQAGHHHVAQQIRDAISSLETALPMAAAEPVDIAQPRGDLAGLLEGGHADERLHSIILEDPTQQQLVRVLAENRRRVELLSWSVAPTRRLLFFGPPGCGKTLAARVLAGELGIPIMTVRIDALFSRYLGETAQHIKFI